MNCESLGDLYGLNPHLVPSLKIGRDKSLPEELGDIAGLHLNPTEHAILLCVDEKSQIQALDRTHLGLPLKKGRGGVVMLRERHLGEG